MKRDMDLVRDILLLVERADSAVGIEDIDLPRRSAAEVEYHVRIMASAGLLDATICYGWDGSAVGACIDGLTWEGQDMLDAVRDARVWSRARDAIRRGVGSTTFGVVKSVCEAAAVGLAKGGLGL